MRDIDRDRLDNALAEIARRREVAADEAQFRAREPWALVEERKTQFAEDSNPAYVLAVLDAAEGTLRRHSAEVHSEPWCTTCEASLWPCPDAGAILDIYAPSVRT